MPKISLDSIEIISDSSAPACRQAGIVFRIKERFH